MKITSGTRYRTYPDRNLSASTAIPLNATSTPDISRFLNRSRSASLRRSTQNSQPRRRRKRFKTLWGSAWKLMVSSIMLIPQMKLSRISASFHPPARAITIRNTEPNRFLLSSHELQIRVVSLRRIFRHIRHFVQSIPKSSSVSVSENGCFFMARMQNEPPAL